MSDGLSNAVLTGISTPGALDSHGRPTSSSTVWTGEATGYLKRIHRAVPMHRGSQSGVPTGAEIVKTDVFWILGGAGAPPAEVAGADWEGSTVTIIDQRTSPPVTRTFRVVGMENRAIGSPVDNVRLELATPAGGPSTG